MPRALGFLAACVLLGAAGPGSAAAGGPDALDRAGGFLDAKFGDRREELHGLVETRTLGAIRMYVRAVDRKSYRGAHLLGIGYIFHGDLLFAVVLVPFSDGDFERLHAIFTADYGEEHELSGASPEWWGKRVGLQFLPNPDGPPFAVFMDRHEVERIRSWGTEPFDVLTRLM
jgi:hypothetical protein